MIHAIKIPVEREGFLVGSGFPVNNRFRWAAGNRRNRIDIMTQESLFLLFDLAGTFAFAMAGAFKAIRKNLDLLGILVLGFATAMGGGVIRVKAIKGKHRFGTTPWHSGTS